MGGYGGFGGTPAYGGRYGGGMSYAAPVTSYGGGATYGGGMNYAAPVTSYAAQGGYGGGYGAPATTYESPGTTTFGGMGTTYGAQPAGGSMFDMLDRNHDGKISRDEFNVAMR